MKEEKQWLERQQTLLQKGLEQIPNLAERRMMRRVLEDVYSNMIAYHMEMYDRLEQRIYEEIPDPLAEYYITTTLLERKALDPISDFFHPMVEEDREERTYDLAEIQKDLTEEKQVTLLELFLQCDALTYKTVLEEKRQYVGKIKTNLGSYDITVVLQETKKYQQKIEKLYHIFQKNGVLWHTVHCPYAYRFVDVVLCSELSFEAEESIIEIAVDLEEYDKYKVWDMVPVWNIKEVVLKDKSFPMPAKDSIHFEHMLSLEQETLQGGYLAGLENQFFLYLRRYETSLVLVSTEGEQTKWKLLKIEPEESLGDRERYVYGLFSNKRKLGFLGRFASVKSIVVRTRGELERVIAAYTEKEPFSFVNVVIVDRYTKPIQTRNCNPFLEENIRTEHEKKVMVLQFQSQKEDDMVYDRMSFLVSELQILFPEYHCVGEVVL